MNIQLVVPTKGCVNNCPFCCSKMHNSPYENKFDAVEIEKRIKYAVMSGIDTCVLTGTGEILQNTKFLRGLYQIFKKMDFPFPNMELQTTGVMLMDYEEKYDVWNKLFKTYYNIDIIKDLRVNTISLSISDLFNDQNNNYIIGVSNKLKFKLPELISFLKAQNFNVRLSLNMLNNLDGIMPERIFQYAKTLGADQISFKKMYYNNEFEYTQNNWIKENMCNDKTIHNITKYINEKGKYQYTLKFGSKVYSVCGLSTVIVEDCMAVKETENWRYVILRENGKLYCHWDDEGSLIF
jgi:hypothetical protein